MTSGAIRFEPVIPTLRIFSEEKAREFYLDFLVDRWEGELRLDEEELTGGLWLEPKAALDLPLTFTTRQAVEFYLAHLNDGTCDYDPVPDK